MTVEWYEQWKGTEYDGGWLPHLYHPYAGHDNNRDWYMFNLVETRMVSEVMYDTWVPQVAIDHHQMWMTGARLFVPPYADPVNPNLDPLLWRETRPGRLQYAAQAPGERLPGRDPRRVLHRLVGGRGLDDAAVAQHREPADRGGLVPGGHPGLRRSQRARRVGHGLSQVHPALQFPRSLAGRMVAPERHYGLRSPGAGRRPRGLLAQQGDHPDELLQDGGGLDREGDDREALRLRLPAVGRRLLAAADGRALDAGRRRG